MAIEMKTAVPPELSEVDRNRQAVMQFLQRHCDQSCGQSSPDNIESQPVFDQAHDRYLIVTQGWRGQERVYWVAMHLELRNGKIWIQRNQTEVDVEAELVELGISQQSIVLGLIPPAYRTLAGLIEA